MMNQICLPDPNRKKNARNSHIAVHPALSRSGDTPPARYHTAQDPSRHSKTRVHRTRNLIYRR